MLIQPIPPILLPNTIQYVAYTGSERYDDTWDEDNPVTIMHVRVDDSSQFKPSRLVEVNDFDSMLYVDTKTSNEVIGGVEQDLSIVPKEKDHVMFNDRTYQIDKVIVLQTDRGIHHYECQLNRV
jgi:hypothetical protein